MAGYIFGNNKAPQNSKTAMTAPVTMAPQGQLALTAPVTVQPATETPDWTRRCDRSWLFVIWQRNEIEIKAPGP